jgi:hypothetical protein
MKWGLMRTKKFLPLLTVLMFALAAHAQQSLGDVARKSRSERHPAATVRLEGQAIVIPSDEPSPGDQAKKDGNSSAEAKPDDSKAADAKAPDGKAAGAKDEPKKSATELAQQKVDGWKKKIDTQKQEIATLQRELDIAQREQRLRAAAYYADAGTQLRDPGRFAEDSRKEQGEIDAKKQALEAANQKLADMQEQARKEGVSASPTD